MQNFLSNRLLIIAAAFSLIGVMIFVRIGDIQTRQEMKDIKTNQEKTHGTVPMTVVPERGSIYDRNGKLLAGSKEVFIVGIDRNSFYNTDHFDQESTAIANAVALATGESAGDLITAALSFKDEMVSVNLADGVTPEQATKLSEMRYKSMTTGNHELRAMFLISHLRRSYPEGTLASNILGYVNFFDPQNPKGVYGVEGYYDSYLAGKTEKRMVPVSPYEITSVPTLPTGASLVLTINRELQASVESIIDQATKDNAAKSGTAIVMDPKTGEILAMASTPRLNPNEYWRVVDDFQKKSIPLNRAISQLLEPGSVFKPLTVSIALENKVITPSTTYRDVGVYSVNGWPIYNWAQMSYGQQDVTGCLRHSINTCLTNIALTFKAKLGADKFYETLKSFRIGLPSNVDMVGEDYYPMRMPNDTGFSDLSMANNSFGQGVMVSPLQILSALSAIPNGGKIMQPHVLKAIIDNGRQYNNPPQIVSQPVSAETADTVSKMLAEAVKDEAYIKIDGYSYAGKTGTAEIAMPGGGGYYSNLTNASFVAWGPVDDPKFIIYVWLEQPGGPQPYGSVVAAPIFKDIYLSAVQLYDLPPDSVRKQLSGK